jgi:hypothetical protein
MPGVKCVAADNARLRRSPRYGRHALFSVFSPVGLQVTRVAKCPQVARIVVCDITVEVMSVKIFLSGAFFACITPIVPGTPAVTVIS